MLVICRMSGFCFCFTIIHLHFSFIKQPIYVSERTKENSETNQMDPVLRQTI